MIAVSADTHPLRLILILRKIFEIETTVNLVKESPDQVEQY